MMGDECGVYRSLRDVLAAHFGPRGSERAAAVLADLVARRIALCTPLDVGWHAAAVLRGREGCLPLRLEVALAVSATLRDLEEITARLADHNRENEAMSVRDQLRSIPLSENT